MHKLIDYICEELEEIERKADKEQKLSMAEIQYADTLAHMKKNLLKAEEMMGDGEEMGGSSYRRGGGSSYRRGGSSRAGEDSMQSRARQRRDAMGRFSRDGGSSRYEGGSSRRGGSSYYDGGASYGDGMQDMVESIYSVMDQLPENVKHDAQKLAQKVEQEMM